MYRTHFLMVVIGAFGIDLAFGDSPDRYVCAGRPVEIVHSISDLPDEVQVLLGYRRTGIDGLVDSDAKLNTTDPNLPMRRFTWAALNSDCVFALVERAGHDRFEVFDFRHAPQRWISNNHWFYSREAPTVAMVMHGVK